MMPDLYRPFAVLLLGAFTLPAQQKLDARSFLPQHYQAEFFADLEAMRECEFLDGLERAYALRMLRSMLQSSSGIDANDLHRARIATLSLGDGEVDEAGIERVTILEGAEVLGLPEASETRTAAEVAGRQVLREAGYGSETLWVSPQPGLLVIGESALIEQCLQGERRGGVPHPDLMAITAVRTPLLHFAAARCGMDNGRWVKLMGFPEDWITEEDPVETAVLRLELVEGEMVASAELRFANGEKGPELFASGLREALGVLKAEPPLAPSAKVLEKVELAQPDGGLTLKLKLGSPREASQQVAQMLTPMAFLVGTVDAAPIVIEVDAEVPAPAPPKQSEKPAPEKKK